MVAGAVSIRILKVVQIIFRNRFRVQGGYRHLGNENDQDRQDQQGKEEGNPPFFLSHCIETPRSLIRWAL